MITAFLLFLLFIIVLVVALATGAIFIALRLAMLVVRLVFQILALPFLALGGFRRPSWRGRRW
jgi:hypothetical protein